MFTFKTVEGFETGEDTLVLYIWVGNVFDVIMLTTCGYAEVHLCSSSKNYPAFKKNGKIILNHGSTNKKKKRIPTLNMK